MIEQIRSELEHYLPLRVAGVDSDADGVLLHGDAWHLRINTGWRWGLGNRVEVSDADQVSKLSTLIGSEVVGIQLVEGEHGFDIELEMASGVTLGILSDFPYSEWLFSIWDSADDRKVPSSIWSGQSWSQSMPIPYCE